MKKKAIVKAIKPKKLAKLINPDAEVYDYYQQCLKEGKGATSIAAVASKFRCNSDMAWLAIKRAQEAHLEKLTKLNSKEKDPVKKATQEQILELTSLKSSNDVAKHKATTQIRVNKYAAFAHTNTQQLDNMRSVFRNYVEINLGYEKPDANILVYLFNAEINSDNVVHYLSRTVREIYLGILNENLDSLANFTPALNIDGLPLINDYLKITKNK